jgi:hypothetical protein
MSKATEAKFNTALYDAKAQAELFVAILGSDKS